MPKEKGEAQEEQAVAESEESAQEGQTPSVEELISKLEQSEKEKDSLREETTKWQTEAKAHQRTASEKAEEARKLRDNQGSLDTRLTALTEMVADLVDRDTEELEPVKKRRSEDYLSRIKKAEDDSKQTTQKIEQQRVNQIASEADRIARSAGLDMETSGELLKAYNLFLRGNFDDGLEEVKRVVGQKTEAPKETEEALRERIKEEVKKDIMRERGELDTETGLPSGPSGDFQSIEARYIKGEVSGEEYAKAKEKYQKY